MSDVQGRLGPGEPPPWPDGRVWRERMEAVGFQHSRRLGQNFLVDSARCAAIADLAEPLLGARVLEVGVGLGYLTRHLLERGARVLGVEVDGRLADLVQGDLEALARWRGTELELLRGDALAGKGALHPRIEGALANGEPWHVVANLPYAIASPLVALLAAHPRPPRAMVVLVQLEVAERLAAGPGGADWGALSVRVQAVYRARLALRIPPGAFRPAPKVTSAVVRLELREDRPDDPTYGRLVSLTRAAFSQRRKRLRNTLAATLGSPRAAEAWCVSVGVDPGARAQELTRDQFCDMAAHWPHSGRTADGGWDPPDDG